MILFFGTRLRRRLLDTGTFRCPLCGVDRPYDHLEVRTWFHLFWVPVVPLGRPQEALRCHGCGVEWPAGLTGPA